MDSHTQSVPFIIMLINNLRSTGYKDDVENLDKCSKYARKYIGIEWK